MMNNNMMKQAQKLQNDLMRAQEKMKDLTIEGSAGGGIVKVFGDGSGKISEVKIQPDAVDPDDIEFLEDLVLASFNKYQEEIDKISKEQMGPLAGGLGGLF